MSNKITAVRFPDVSNDMGICDVARVSFAKEASQFTEEKNKGLIKYLKDHFHWAPMGQARFTLKGFIETSELLRFLCNANMAGFKFSHNPDIFKKGWAPDELELNGSVWAFWENKEFVPWSFLVAAEAYIKANYPWFWEFSFGTMTVFNREVSEVRVVPPAECSVKTRCVSLRGEAPIYIVRQLGKHQVGLTWNEVSRRYVDTAPEHFNITDWRAKPLAGQTKQGSSHSLDVSVQREINELVCGLRYSSDTLYSYLTEDLKVAAEQARSVLLQDMQTEWIWTGGVLDFKRMCKERLAPTAQKETKGFAEQVDAILREEIGELWDTL